jgi:hypothetical protein
LVAQAQKILIPEGMSYRFERLTAHPALRKDRSIWREFHLVGKPGGAILADGGKTQI